MHIPMKVYLRSNKELTVRVHAMSGIDTTAVHVIKEYNTCVR
jgi:hypothetical protein